MAAAAAARCLFRGRSLQSAPALRSPAASPLPVLPSGAASLNDSASFPSSCKDARFPRFPCPPRCSSSDLQEPKPTQDLAVLLEVEGVVADLYRLGNRQAFNTAFQKLGLDCANWTEPIYVDLMRKAAGDEERMLVLFFNRVGWPSSLPTNEKEKFMKKILREKVVVSTRILFVPFQKI